MFKFTGVAGGKGLAFSWCGLGACEDVQIRVIIKQVTVGSWPHTTSGQFTHGWAVANLRHAIWTISLFSAGLATTLTHTFAL